MIATMGSRPQLLHAGVALVAGGILPFAFAPYSLFPIAWLSLGTLFYLWSAQSARGAALLGAAYGLGMFGHGVWWIQVSIHQFGLPVHAFSIGMTALFVMTMSAYPALCGFVANRLAARSSLARILPLYPAVWTLSELLRGHLFTGFPWLLIGYSQIDAPLAAFAPLIGAYGLSLCSALIASFGLVLLRTRGVGQLAAVLALVGLFVFAIALEPIRWSHPIATPRTVALIQGAVPQALKWDTAYRQPSIDLYNSLSEAHWGKSLIVWPETAIPAFAYEIPDTIAQLQQRAQNNNSALLVGMPTSKADQPGRYFNSVVQYGPIEGRYDKRHLVPFGEYLPFDDVLRPLTSFLQIPMSNFGRGADKQSPIVVDGIVVGVSICYEDAYAGEVARELPDANVLVNVSNDAWFGDSIAPHQHLEIARMRARELERYMLRATNTGISAIIDERGTVVERSQQFVPAVVAGEFVARKGTTPVASFGAYPILALCLVLVGISFVARPASAPSNSPQARD